MGLIKATTSLLDGGLADQWLEIIEPNNMSDSTVMTKGVKFRRNDRRGANRKGTEDVITDGSVVHVYPNMMMFLVDGGKIIDYAAEEGYYTVKNDSAPSALNGSVKKAISETFNRFKYGGVTPQKQQVFYINLQEIKGIKFGTSSPLNYFDNFYNAELFLRTRGNYSIHITDPLLFFANAIPKNKTQVDINDINEQYSSEFLAALQAAINQMSADGERVSHVSSKSLELGKYMSNILDESWKSLRGMEIITVAIANISYTDDSKKLINMRNQGALLSDPSVREGYIQGALARGVEAAGSNEGGAITGFMGLNMGMNSGGNFLNQTSASNQQQIQEKQNQQQIQNFSNTWSCSKCSSKNTGKFCSNCGTSQSTNNILKLEMKCSECAEIVNFAKGIPKFCPECGKPFQGIPL